MKYILLILSIMIAGCSSQAIISKEVKEAQAIVSKNEKIIETAKAEIDRNKKIVEAGNAYLETIGTNIPKDTKKVEIEQNETKVSTIGGYICLAPNSSETQYKEYKSEDMTYLEDCGAFAGLSECWISQDGDNCLKQE